MQRGSVRIGVNEGYVTRLMDDVLNDFSERYPRLNIHVDVLLTNEIIAQVIQDDLHIGLAYNPQEHPDIFCHMKIKRPVRLLVGKTHPLANQRTATIEDALHYPLGLMSVTSGLSQTILLLEATEKIRLTPTITTNSIMVLEEFVSAGKGVAFMAPFMKYSRIKDGELVALDIDHPILTSPEINLFVRQGRPLSSAINQLLKQAKGKLLLFKQDS